MSWGSDGFEQGPIRPPSEADSLLVRVSRNCPWNRCAFCPVYKGERFSLRSADEVLADLDAQRELYGAEGPRSVFLQDANPLLTKPDELARIVEGVRERFPRVRRVTAYARSHTLARRSPDDLRRIREAGLDRLHVGLESGCDDVLRLVRKGTTREEQIVAGQRARAAGFELSEYVMPGLGGRRLTDAHADDTASALVAIRPDFVRLRTLAVLPGTELGEMAARGDFQPLTELGILSEIRRFLAGLRGLERTRLESDHVLNLLVELRGELPAELDHLLALCDEVLALPEATLRRFLLARRLGWRGRPEHVETSPVRPEVDRVLASLDAGGADVDELLSQLRTRIL